MKRKLINTLICLGLAGIVITPLNAQVKLKKLKGKVYNFDTQAPESGVSIITKEGQVKTDDKGKFVIEIAPALQEITITKKGFFEETRLVNKPKKLKIQLTPQVPSETYWEKAEKITLKGSVLDKETQLPVSDAQVMVKGFFEPMAATNILGAFTVEVPKDRKIVLIVTASKYTLENYVVRVTEESAKTPMEILLRKETESKVLTLVEKQAQFPGGMERFYQYLSREIQYPSNAKKMGVEGTVFLQYVVNKDGSITDIKVVKGIGSGCDEEAVRVLKNSPKWIPAEHKGEIVRVRMTVPIKFILR